ncbi:hypothetical protein Sjap_011955 [Stephania japonica]|uniref:Uncharacterized protein n=1 Tax=Stephania japonica TaxID=461633 RepID=A0AAP0P5G4_9MAGN
MTPSRRTLSLQLCQTLYPYGETSKDALSTLQDSTSPSRLLSPLDSHLEAVSL